MPMNNPWSIAAAALILFAAGFGWGQWRAEKQLRQERTALEANRVLVSMPMHADHASKMMGLLKDLIEQVESDKPTQGASDEK
jgi:hypothetical protein